MIAFDYKLSTRFYTNTTQADLVSADEMSLRYNLFLGDIMLKDSTHDFSAKWEWIPIVDFVASLKFISRELLQGKLESEFEFTESDAKIRFKRQQQSIVISASYAPGEIILTQIEFAEAVEKFEKRVAAELMLQYPRLAENKAFLKLLPFYCLS